MGSFQPRCTVWAAVFGLFLTVVASQSVEEFNGVYEFTDTRGCCSGVADGAPCETYTVTSTSMLFQSRIVVEQGGATVPCDGGSPLEEAVLEFRMRSYDEATGCLEFSAEDGESLYETVEHDATTGELIVYQTPSLDMCPPRGSAASTCTCQGGERQQPIKILRIPRAEVEAAPLLGIWEGTISEKCCSVENGTCSDGHTRDLVSALLAGQGNVMGATIFGAGEATGCSDAKDAEDVAVMIASYDATTGCGKLMVVDDDGAHITHQTMLVSGDTLTVSSTPDGECAPQPYTPPVCECDGFRARRGTQATYTRRVVDTNPLNGAFAPASIPKRCCLDDTTSTCTEVDKDIVTVIQGGFGTTLLGSATCGDDTETASLQRNVIVDFDETTGCAQLVIMGGSVGVIRQTYFKDGTTMWVVASDHKSCPATSFEPDLTCTCSAGVVTVGSGYKIGLTQVSSGMGPDCTQLIVTVGNLDYAYVTANQVDVGIKAAVDLMTAFGAPVDPSGLTFAASTSPAGTVATVAMFPLLGETEADLRAAVDAWLLEPSLPFIEALPQAARLNAALPMDLSGTSAMVSCGSATSASSGTATSGTSSTASSGTATSGTASSGTATSASGTTTGTAGTSDASPSKASAVVLMCALFVAALF